MAAISRDEVANLARLARITMSDDELDHLAGEMDVILGAVARVQGWHLLMWRQLLTHLL
jgi:aspartyl-tRNA(Asn)/glutamyl-tRNA(Gln) amidotransferase subunit C